MCVIYVKQKKLLLSTELFKWKRFSEFEDGLKNSGFYFFKINDAPYATIFTHEDLATKATKDQCDLESLQHIYYKAKSKIVIPIELDDVSPSLISR